MTVRVDVPQLPVIGPSTADGEAVVEAYRDDVVARTKSGQGPGGRPLGTYQRGARKGQPVTGAGWGFLDAWTTRAAGAGVETSPASDHAGYLADRYGWADADKDTDAAVERALDRAADDQLKGGR